METVLLKLDPGQRDCAATPDAWTALWKDPGHTHYFTGTQDAWRALAGHWSRVAQSLAAGARVLDLGCGAGSVARLLLARRGNLQVTGIDSAEVPRAIFPGFELLADTPMEFLPFGDRCFDAVVSQFGFEYGRAVETVGELSRVLAPGAQLSFLVHHSEGALVARNRTRLHALNAFLHPQVRAAFCSGDDAALLARMLELRQRHPHDARLAELSFDLPSRRGRSRSERTAIWAAIEYALAPECRRAESLNACCVSAAALETWLAPLDSLCHSLQAVELRDGNGEPIAWQIEGRLPAVCG